MSLSDLLRSTISWLNGWNHDDAVFGLQLLLRSVLVMQRVLTTLATLTCSA